MRRERETWKYKRQSCVEHDRKSKKRKFLIDNEIRCNILLQKLYRP